MNIAIDITPLETAHGGRGVGTYTKNIIEALQQYEGQHSYSIFTRVQKVPENADLVHYPYFDPFFLTLPLVKAKPTVVTVHDLIPFVFPDKFPAGVRGALKWRIQKQSLSGAKRIITDSKNSKQDIVRITGIPADRIDTVYLAADPGIKRVNVVSRQRPFILYVGDVNWNKNVPGFLRAVASVPDIRIVLVGSPFTDEGLPETKEINNLIGALGIENRITRTGRVADKELSELYSSAVCLVQPSFYEGFGLPVVDAMQCGCPVVVSDVSSLHEIAGPSVKVKPEPSSIAQGITHVLKFTSTQRKKLIDDQTAWVAHFSWKKAAHETAEVYEKTFNYHSGI